MCWSSAHATQEKHNSCCTLLLNCHFRRSNLHQSLFVSSRCIPKRCQGNKTISHKTGRHLVNIILAFLQFKLAILDYARAAHLEPNNPTYYLFKVKCDSVSWLTKTIVTAWPVRCTSCFLSQGELHFHLGELDLAALHISIAAKLSTGFDQEKSQRALVDSFLGNYEQVRVVNSVLISGQQHNFMLRAICACVNYMYVC